ncbi:hypothetical protein NITGR_850009 [Nitrospina gracilis 3/211]|uniref:Uncharacterized protein n=1 Tax=Nitrospina gracilis (strain 3/211) TaxID=1266370 RepID=M1Z1F8_NITG3|nr:hypothetical protein NITGR_850009 [Nitrospina gracilis 3/211]
MANMLNIKKITSFLINVLLNKDLLACMPEMQFRNRFVSIF